MERVITYIDGFNLYFGMMAAGLTNCRWLNVQTLGQGLLKSNQNLVATKYFTARISGPADKRIRQQTYLEALGTLEGPDFSIYYGRYQDEETRCPLCHKVYISPHEKMTDVSIAVEMVADAFQDNFDVARLISGDADLTAPIETIKRLFPNKRVIIAFPPSRFSYMLKTAAHGYFNIKPDVLLNSQLPENVQRADGFILQRPSRWI